VNRDEYRTICDTLYQRGYRFYQIKDTKGVIIKQVNQFGVHEWGVELQMNEEIYMMDDTASLRDLREIKSRFAADGNNRLTHEDFVPDANIIHFRNGIYAIRERKFYHHDACDDPAATSELVNVMMDYNLNTFTVIPHDYNPDAEPLLEFTFFLDTVFPDADTRERWWQFMGLCLSKEVFRAKKAMLFLGPAHSGKTTLAHVMRAAVGEENFVEKKLHDLLETRWGKAGLVGKLVAYDDDLGESTITRIEEFKKLTGHNWMEVEEKGVQPYKTPHTCKLLCLGNVRPRIKKMDDATGSRWTECEFQHRFLPENEYERLTDDERLTASPRDPWFEDRMIVQDNIEGIIAVAIQKLGDLVDADFSFTGLTGEEMVHRWRVETETIYAFLNEECTRDNTLSQSSDKNTVYDAYTSFCDGWGYEAETIHKFTTELKRYGHSVHNTRRNGSQISAYKGVALKNDEIIDIEELEL
jgi:phage/plasmid-associated DNA primase